jgi:hypothetical protein
MERSRVAGVFHGTSRFRPHPALSLPNGRNRRSMRPSLTTILRGALLGVATAAVLGLRSDPDLWGHMRSGFDFLDTFTVPSTDIYSFTADQRWTNHEWLFDVVVALIYRGMGPVGFSVAAALLAMASIAVSRVTARGAGVGGWRLDALTAGVFLFGIAPLLQTFRAQEISALLFLVLLRCIRAFDAGRHRSMWMLPPLFLVWANIHGGWVLGGTILAIWALARWASSPRDRTRQALIGICALAAGATFLNPDGTHLWTFLLDTVRLERTDIREWHPVVTSVPMLIVWCAATAVLVAAAWRAPRGARVYVALAAFTALSSFRVMRLLPFHVMTVGLMAGPWLLSPRREAEAEPDAPFALRDWMVATLVWALVVGGSVARNGQIGCLQPAGAFSLDGRAAHFLRDNQAEGRLLVYFDWGEYVLWHLGPRLKVSIDGRRETVYSPQTIARHQTFYKAEPGARAYLEELAPDLIWLPRKVKVSKLISGWGWQPVFESPESVIWARTASPRQWQAAQPFEPSRCFPGP